MCSSTNLIPPTGWPTSVKMSRSLRPPTRLELMLLYSCGGRWEFKSPTGKSRNTILTNIRRAADGGKHNFVLDVTRPPMSIAEARDLA